MGKTFEMCMPEDQRRYLNAQGKAMHLSAAAIIRLLVMRAMAEKQFSVSNAGIENKKKSGNTGKEIEND